MPDTQKTLFPILPDQLRGPVRYEAYGKLFRRMARGRDEATGYANIDRALAEGTAPHGGGILIELLEDASETIAVECARVNRAGISTLDTRRWAGAADLLMCAHRLALFPGYAPRNGVSARSLVESACIVVDGMFALADNEIGGEHLVEGQRRRVSRLYLDVLCGRVAPWLAAIDDCGRVAALASDERWAEVWEAYARERELQYLAAVSRAVPSHDLEWVAGALGRALGAVSLIAEARQTADLLECSTGYEPTLGDVIACYDPEVMGVVGELLDNEGGICNDGPGLSGYCVMGKVTPAGCAFAMAPDTARSVQANYLVLAREVVRERVGKE